MMQQTRLKNLFLLGLLLIGMLARSQSFGYFSKLDSIQVTGFYRIPLHAELLSHLRIDYSDLRIEDNNKKFIPYIIERDWIPLNELSLIQFPILSNRLIDSGKTEIIMSNDSAKKIFNIKLFIKNASVSRTGSLSGSNDRQNWFIIDDQVMIGRSYESVMAEYLQEIVFPFNDYRFYKLVIDNKKNDPMNIVKAGTYTQYKYRLSNFYELNPQPQLSQVDSGKYSLVSLSSDKAYHINRIQLEISGSKFYDRDFQIFSIDTVLSTKSLIGDFSLNSGTSPIFDFPTCKTNSLLLVIDNKDNPPLKIDWIYSQHTRVFAIAYLENTKVYRLLLDNPFVSKPEYDLSLFKDSIPAKIVILGHQEPIAFETTSAKSTNRNWWIWPVLIGVIAIMGFLTYKLSGDMKFNK